LRNNFHRSLSLSLSLSLSHIWDEYIQEGKALEIEKGSLGPEMFDHIQTLKHEAFGAGGGKGTKKRKQQHHQIMMTAMLKPPPVASRPTKFSYPFMPPESRLVISASARRPTQAAWDRQVPGSRLEAAEGGWFTFDEDGVDDDGALGALRDKLLLWADSNIEEYERMKADPEKDNPDDDKTGLQELQLLVQRVRNQGGTEEGVAGVTGATEAGGVDNDKEAGKDDRGGGGGGVGGWFSSFRDKALRWADKNIEEKEREDDAAKLKANKTETDNNNNNSNNNDNEKKKKKTKNEEQMEAMRSSLLAWAEKHGNKNNNHERGLKSSSALAGDVAEDLRDKILTWANHEEAQKGKKKNSRKSDSPSSSSSSGAGVDDDGADANDNPRARLNNVRLQMRSWIAGYEAEKRLRSADEADEEVDAQGNLIRKKTGIAAPQRHHLRMIDTRGFSLSDIQNKIARWDAEEAVAAAAISRSNIEQTIELERQQQQAESMGMLSERQQQQGHQQQRPGL
jgi:hypothetical protein